MSIPLKKTHRLSRDDMIMTICAMNVMMESYNIYAINAEMVYVTEQNVNGLSQLSLNRLQLYVMDALMTLTTN